MCICSSGYISNTVVVDKRGPIAHEYTLVLGGWLGAPFDPLLHTRNKRHPMAPARHQHPQIVHKVLNFSIIS